MKLFSEYYAGHSSHQYHLFGEDDMSFLEQFPHKFWNLAMEQRYCADLPRALLKREEARNQPLSGLKDENGNPVTSGYYEYIQRRADGIYDSLAYTGGNNPDGTPNRERKRIKDMTFNSAKNMVDSELSQRTDKGGKWMEVKLLKKKYEFFYRGKPYSHTIGKNYIKELVDRLEGGTTEIVVDGETKRVPARGNSPRGYDLSKIQNFDPSIEDSEQQGNWHTFGFNCPDVDIIRKNTQAWLSYHSQGLLDDPKLSENEAEAESHKAEREAHRMSPRFEYEANKEATDGKIEEAIYRSPLFAKYRMLINLMKEMFEENNGNIDDGEIQKIKKQFKKTKPRSNRKDPIEYAYSAALRGNLKYNISEALNINPLNLHNELTDEKIKELIKMLVEGHSRLQNDLIEGLAEIDLISHEIDTFQGNKFDVEKGSKTKILTRQKPGSTNPEEKIPELKKGKIIFHIPTIRRKLENKIATAALRRPMEDGRRSNEETDEERNAKQNFQNFENLVKQRSIGHHFDVLDIENPNKQRDKIFLQFNDESEIPSYIDFRDRNLGGGLNPNQNIPDAVGPGNKNVVSALRNLSPFIVNPARLTDIIKRYISSRHDTNFNILFKTFADNVGNPTHQQAFKLFVDLIKDQCLRNIGDFELSEDEQNRPEAATIRKINRIINATCKRLTEKDLGETGTERTRMGEISDTRSAILAMKDMMKKTVRD